ncbi:UNVERIFIED_CONTAM: hypothetical protein Sradi_6892300 [Sesamum radiatum]|uniref:Zinc knuckle CX2CX4HX4C domain-containing protein n=1 Tax=Sesamum radiatum TaxID=300843 RepID=A0AAW2JJH6_SESRA
MLDFHSQLPKHLVVLSPILTEGKEIPIKVDIEYEWLPLRCKQCCSLGHTANSCPDVKVVKQRVPVLCMFRNRDCSERPRGIKWRPRRARWSHVEQMLMWRPRRARWSHMGVIVLLS